MPRQSGDDVSLLGVRLRLFKPVFFPEGQSVSISVLNQDGSIAKSVCSFPDEVELQANPEFIIPIQVFTGSTSSCTTLFVPLSEVMRHSGHMPVFCTLWLGVPIESWKDPAYNGDACAIEQHFQSMLNLGKELTHPKLGVGVRLTNMTSTGATPREHLGLFRVVDMYEDLLAHVYVKTNDHLKSLSRDLSFEIENKRDSRSRSPSRSDTPKRQVKQDLQEKQDSDPSKKMERLLALLAQKQKKITQLQAEVHKFKKQKEVAPLSCKEMYDKAFASPVAVKEKKACTSLAPVVEASSKSEELEEARSKYAMLEIELKKTQEAAKSQMDLQTKRFVQSMREIQSKAGDYEEEMKRRDMEISELRSELEQARLESDDYREMYDLQRENNEKEFEEEMKRRDKQHELLVNELKQVRAEMESQRRLVNQSSASRETSRVEVRAQERNLEPTRSSTSTRHRAVTMGTVEEYSGKSSSKAEAALPTTYANVNSRSMADW
eukprot:CAMPEP_0169114574 /NCGR_PEP_ID=MMETSP1015-20121227/28834_1 /TAXON_ID=342587 /ORGANISM="Karlodinium micrum, Strain CCMP2283" /LENGTH=491 /DNA_ID=CAMNT_0009176873 /DNA_START=53 /DNA_END=1525 /DNA_ORIENTATION=-